jgi:hypothetical protein
MITAQYECYLQCKIGGSHSAVVENANLVRCDAMSISSYQCYEEVCSFHFWDISSL